MRAGEILADRFAIESLAGTGGMGAVYRARDLHADRTVALKVLLRASDSARFEREAQVLAQLQSPAVVRYVAHGTDARGQQWLAMEWLEGEDLQVRLTRGPLTWREAIALGRRVAEGLGAAHERGVVHRDVKPTNVLLEGGDPARARVLDFGIARVGEGRSHTLTGAVLGTPGYLAPEQARGDERVDARADVFALGSLLFECIAGAPCFGTGNVMGVLTRILFQPAPCVLDHVAGVPDELDALISRMLEKEPAERPRDGGEVAAALARIEEEPSSLPSWDDISIGHSERSLASVIVVLRGRGGVVDRVRGEEERALAGIAEGFGARIESLIDGSIAALISGARVATDQAATAARCALALRAAIDSRAIGVATGGAVLGLAPRIGEIIGRAVELVGTAASGVRVDEVTADLLGDRFELRRIEGGAELLGQASAAHGPSRRVVGREREVARLVELFEQSAEEPLAQAAVLIGAAGIGKSSVLHAATARIRGASPAARVWIARAEPSHESAPFAALASALRSAIVEDGATGEPTAAAVRAFVSARATDVAGVAAVVAALLGTAEPQDAGDAAAARLRSARSAPGHFADLVVRALGELVAGECGRGPLVLVVEDVHACDAPSIDAIDVLLRRLPTLPWLVIATARPELDERFPGLWAGRRVARTVLGALSRRAAESLAREWLGEKAGAAEVDAIVAQAEGHPFFLEELARAARSGAKEAPGSVQAMLHARLDALPARLRRALRAASVLGERIDVEGLRAIAAGTSAEELASLAAEEILVREGEGWRFRHQLLREVAYSMLTDEDRTLAHRLAAQHLERRGDARAAALAEHWSRGGEGERAARALGTAAAEALAANDLVGAVAHAERGLAHKPGRALRGELRLAIAEAWLWRGRIAEARDAGERAMRSLPHGSREWCAAVSVRGTAEGRLGNNDALGELGRALAAVEPRAESAGTIATGLARIAMHLFFAGRFDEARVAAARLEEMASTFPEDRVIDARLAQTRAVEARYAGDAVGHLRWTERALEGFDAIEDRRTACVLRSNLGDGWKELGRYAEAEACLRAALAEALELGIEAVVGPVQLNLGVVLSRRGAPEDGLAMLEQAVAGFGRAGDRRFEAAGRIFVAEALLASGREEEARTAIDTASSLLEEASPYRPLALAIESACRRAIGDVAGALACANEAVAYLDTLGHAEEGDLAAHLARAEALELAADREGARGAIAEARRRLEAAGASLGEWRSTFEQEVPDHRRILELAREWQVA